jgi:hypothetical protein
MWCVVALAAISAVLTAVTAIWPDWIEVVLDESPDGGDGSIERLLAAAWFAGTVLFFLLARRDYRRLKAA